MAACDEQKRLVVANGLREQAAVGKQGQTIKLVRRITLKDNSLRKQGLKRQLTL